jgi:ribonuclease D
MVALESPGKNVVGIDTEVIRTAAIKELLDVIDSVRGKKALVLDPTLTGPLGLVALLKDHGIDKVYHLEPDAASLVANHDKVIYLSRPSQRNAEIILGVSRLL